MANTFARLNSLAELKRSIDTGGTDSGGSEFADFSSHVRAAVETVRESIVGKSWLHAAVFQRSITSSYSDLGASISTIDRGAQIGASINPFHIIDLPASAYGIPAIDLPAIIEAVGYVDLGASTEPIPPVDLGAIGGGHPPADLPAILNITQPVNLPAYIRAGFSGQLDIGASVNPSGGYVDISAYVKTMVRFSSDIGASVKPRVPVDIRAIINGSVIKDISASIVTQRVKDLNAIINGWAREVIKNLPAVIRRSDSQTSDLPVQPIKAVVSTHTSNKVPNLDKVSRPFYENRYLFGTQAKGLFILNIEPVFGVFPDLHASIFAQGYYRASLGAFVRPAFRSTKDIGTFVVAVSPYININKITISPNPLKDLSASLVQRGAIKRLPASLTPVQRGSTGTSDDAGYVTTASSYKFLIGTSKGLFIPENNVPTVRVTTFKNSHPTPDLRAYIQGYVVSDLGAYIKDYSYVQLSSTIDSIGPNRYRDLPSQVTPAHLSTLSASVTSSGQWSTIPATINTAGGVNSISATISSFINPLSFNVVPISTKPFSSLGAIINYDQLVSCAPKSQVVEISAFIRPFVRSTSTISDIPASIEALHLTKDISAEVEGRKKTRIRILTLNFRASTRSSWPLLGIIVPSVSAISDIAASIYGISHQLDLPASITPVRKVLSNVLFTASERAVDLDHPDKIKEILVSFRSKVSSYVYEELTNAVYPAVNGTWAIDLRSVLPQGSFYDRDPDSRVQLIDNVAEFYSVDEAIRNAISLICDRRVIEFGASITGRGSSTMLSAAINMISEDRFKEFRASLVSVFNTPDMSASINVGENSSGYSALSSVIIAKKSDQSSSLNAEVSGQNTVDVGAQITPL